MRICTTSESFGLIKNINIKSTIITVIVLVAIASGVNGQSYKESAETFKFELKDANALHRHIEQIITGLEYSSAVAADFADMVCNWMDKQGRSVLVDSSEKLVRSQQAHKKGQISEAQLARVEEGITMELGRCIRKELGYKRDYFDLIDMVRDRKANCFGYSQMFYILGNSVGLSVRPMRVMQGHIANVVTLSDETLIVVDLTRMDGFISERIITKGKAEENGSHWEYKDGNNLVRENKTIHLLDKQELIGEIYFCRGTIYYISGKGDEAIRYYNKTIELNPECAKAYNNRGGAYLILSDHEQAISNFNKAIELDPQYMSAYHNRANTYLDSDQYSEAILDYTNAIELDHGFAKAYFGRGYAYLALGQYDKSITDYTKAIELNPEYARAYYTRAIGYANLTQFSKAKRDMLQAVRLDQTLKKDVEKASDEFDLNLRFD